MVILGLKWPNIAKEWNSKNVDEVAREKCSQHKYMLIIKFVKKMRDDMAI